MYERLLDKTLAPTFTELLNYSGPSREWWLALDAYLQNEFSAKQQIRFPYGNKYGWSTKYSVKNRHICDVFAENEAFAVHLRVSNDCLDAIYDDLSDEAKKICDAKYPCSEGGWITYRVLSQEQLMEVKKILRAKICFSILKSQKR